jgi:hypothetical protein
MGGHLSYDCDLGNKTWELGYGVYPIIYICDVLYYDGLCKFMSLNFCVNLCAGSDTSNHRMFMIHLCTC